MHRNLSGMVVVITGASAGIGRALAIDLSQRGARLVLSARRQDRLEELNRELGGKHLIVPTDVSIEADCSRLIAAAQQWTGRLDTLVCNAGYGIIHRVADTTAQEVQQIFQTNVFGTADCIRSAIPILRQQDLVDGFRGQIVIVSSAAARRGIPYFGVYSATKAAQLSLAEALRVELKPTRIAVTSIHPVGTKTDFFDSAEQISHSRMPLRGGIEVQQTAEQVAAKIVKAIQRPTTEVWPLRISRLALSLATFLPRAIDRALASRKPKQ